MLYILFIFLTAHSGAVLVWALFFFSSFCHDSVKFLSWIRKLKSLILHERTEKSYIPWENWKVLSYMRNTKSLIRYMEDCNVCPMSPNSAQCRSQSNLGFLSICFPTNLTIQIQIVSKILPPLPGNKSFQRKMQFLEPSPSKLHPRISLVV